jgi:hypothetical protein
LDTAAKTIGVSEQDLRSALRDGKSVADVATEHGVAGEKVVDALVAEATAKLDQLHLPEGRTPPTADQIRNAITRAVNAKGLGFRGGRGPGWMPGGPDGSPGGPDAMPGGPGAPGSNDGSTTTTAPNPTTTAPATTTTDGSSATTTTGG